MAFCKNIHLNQFFEVGNKLQTNISTPIQNFRLISINFAFRIMPN